MLIVSQNGLTAIPRDVAAMYVEDTTIRCLVCNEEFIMAEYESSKAAQEVFTDLLMNCESNFYQFPKCNF